MKKSLFLVWGDGVTDAPYTIKRMVEDSLYASWGHSCAAHAKVQGGLYAVFAGKVKSVSTDCTEVVFG